MKRRSIGSEDLEALTAETVGKGGRLRFISRGQSMRPAIRDGDEVELAPPGAEGWRLGDVVLARPPHGPLVLHRLVVMGDDEDGSWVELQGDALPGPAQRLPAEALIAKLVSPQRPAQGIRPLPLRRIKGILQQILGNSSPSA